MSSLSPECQEGHPEWSAGPGQNLELGALAGAPGGLGAAVPCWLPCRDRRQGGGLEPPQCPLPAGAFSPS